MRDAMNPVAKSIVFNGKFFGAPLTGVHRVAEQLVAATDELVAAHVVVVSARQRRLDGGRALAVLRVRGRARRAWLM